MRDESMSGERGAGLIEVMIAMVLLAVGALAALTVYARQSLSVVQETQTSQAFSILSAGSAILDSQSNALPLNGAKITASAAPSSLPATEVAPVQSVLGQMPSASLSWSIQPLNGSVCPCQAQQTVTWQCGSVTTQTVVGY
ncbi:MAG: prepilin-type N-terminal cleavage/methylation domain-containing protein [Acidithiobacillus sp.]|nr:prepilin-type N-terminal cleavage/methylation domain-containing protein [Acidithiobacillus sp.]